MSITPSTGIRSTRARIALVPLLSLGLLGGSVAFAGPAQAHDDRRDDRHGCTVKPLDPKDLHGKWVDFSIKVKCDVKNDGKDSKRTVHIRQLRYEDEKGPRRTDDFLGRSHFIEEFNKHDDDKARIIHSVDKVRNLDKRDAEEVYHVVSFRVQKGNGDWSDWTEWKMSELVEVKARH
ncbi:hypothetical protein [Arthrobacter sp. OY3WO11]|jgi:hypothetical protein|uniref:hypothetical protein n=1 Tax=Arthrobacter sp. OY3WO11 TaxID=1835723 RepID=UPI0007D00288|nr:hypothetical protein [Arthrobacter sp. OY3WO11]OAE03166.1 hypothetical protein A6A22_18390 [Arthrobacter sp. OY3WO11]